MSDVVDVIKASYCSGDIILHELYEYGDSSLGNGIRKLMIEMFNFGYEHALEDGYVSGYSEGSIDGFVSGYNEGNYVGLLQGSLITASAITVLGAGAFGVKKLVDTYKKHKSEKEEKQYEETEC